MRHLERVITVRFVLGAVLCWLGFHFLGMLHGRQFLASAEIELMPAFLFLAFAAMLQLLLHRFEGLQANDKSAPPVDVSWIRLMFLAAASVSIAATAAGNALGIPWLSAAQHLSTGLAIFQLPVVVLVYVAEVRRRRQASPG